MNCKKHAMCHCILKQTCYTNGFQDALRKAATLLKGSPINSKYQMLEFQSALKLICEDILELKEDKRD